MDKANPKTAQGKRGVYSEGMNNNLNKVARMGEDFVVALGYGHFVSVEGVALLEDVVKCLEAAAAICVSYNTYQATTDTGAMTNNGTKTKAKCDMYVLAINGALNDIKVILDNAKPTKSKK